MLERLEEQDQYLWLEDRHGEAALAWVRAQNDRALGILKGDEDFQPLFDLTLRHAVDEKQLLPISIFGGTVWNSWTDETNPLGVLRSTTLQSYKSGDPAWEIIFDVDALVAKEGMNWDFGGLHMPVRARDIGIIALSPDGGDAQVWREYDLVKRRFIKDGFNAPASKSSFSWLDRDTLVIGSAFSEDEVTTSGYPRVVKIWRRGTPLEDAETIFKADSTDVSASGSVIFDRGKTYVFINRAPDFERSIDFLRLENGELRRLPLPETIGGYLLFNGKLLFDLKEPWTPDGSSQTLEPEALYYFDFDAWLNGDGLPHFETLLAPAPERMLQGYRANDDRIFIDLSHRLEVELVVARLRGNEFIFEKTDLPQTGDVHIGWQGEEGNPYVVAYHGDFLVPPSQYLSEDGGHSFSLVKQEPQEFDAHGMVHEHLEARSPDGTMIPYDVIRPKGQSAPVPTVLYGYGGFAVSLFRNYLGTLGKTWLERGNAYVVSHIRGGGEFGEAWHQAAARQNRQKSFDDFIAVAEDLIARGITTPAQLGIQGGSNGGLLVGAVMTQRPELFGAVIMDVPLADMLRYTKLPAGASWIAEYGDPDDPADAAVLRRYSPYHRIERGVRYPPILITSSTADDRVHPGHARKMAARLEASGHRQVWFHEETEGGHKGGTNLIQSCERFALTQVFWRQHLEKGRGRVDD